MASSHAIYPSLRGKTVLITGGAEGIGAATVELFTLQGCQVIFLDIAETSAIKTIRSAVSRPQDAKIDAKTPIFYKCNVADLSQLQDAVKNIQEKHGMIHILVNNAAAAGNRARLTTENVTPEEWDFNVNTNLRHVFFLSQAVLPAMKEARSGSIINLGSITWRIPAEGTPEFGRFNIRINSVMPGAIATQRQRDEVLTPEYREEVMRGQSLQRDLEPEEVAKVIVFLGSDEASGVTGSSYVVDAGLTATEVLEKFRLQELTVEQYASSLLGRISQRDDHVKAWSYLNSQAVLEQARELDRVPPSERGPLHGLPVAIKDIILTKGMPTEHGSKIYKNDQPEIDAGSIMVLRKAGCLIFGKTTTTEFASSFVGPATRNAHSTSRTPGGSSAGSAAAVADFQIPIAVGSQTMGSIVRPASFNGIYGFKPTFNAITREGQKFCAPSFDTIGFFARAVADFEILADVFDLHDDEQSTFADIRGSKFAVFTTAQWEQANKGTVEAMAKAVELLGAHGADVEELELGPDFDPVVCWHSHITSIEGGTSFLPEYQHSKDQLDQRLAGWVENRYKSRRRAKLDAYNGLAALRPRFDTIADEYVAVLVPSVIGEAPEGLGNTGDPVFASTWTVSNSKLLLKPC
ncbi:amidase signature domain-containing protein [Fusarium tricinctum]|uniref:Amidase signature domain-containing protein n=1 Tax=Fusarium tricinctum TaxID=61284 RepID=A0A8K0WD86_9HYPO|nr:amidase signature domain-containing protein [Fusarium tricinctum]